MFYITEQSGQGALQKEACTMSGYKAGNGNCSLVLIAVTNVDDLNMHLGQWMFLFAERLILCRRYPPAWGLPAPHCAQFFYTLYLRK